MLYDIMSEMMARRGDPYDLFGAVLAARRAHGGRHPIVAIRPQGRSATTAWSRRAWCFGRILARRAKRARRSG